MWLNKYIIMSALTYGETVRFTRTIELWIRTKGPKETIRRLKSIRNEFLRFLSGQSPVDHTIAISKCGIPRCLPLKVDVLRNDYQSIRMVMTLLSISRWIEWWPKPDYSDITEGPKYDKLNFIYTCNLICKVRNAGGLPRFNTEFSWSKFHMTAKAGPNGKALISAMTDFSLLTDSLLESICTFGGEELRKTIQTLKETYLPNKEANTIYNSIMNFKPKKVSCIRRISHIKSPEGKLRPIAIFDYWSQTALQPFHDAIFKSLRHIKEDCTFSQNMGEFQFPKYWCFDLKAATDRFPVDLQSFILGLYLDGSKVSAWRDIMLGHQFVTPEGDQINYNCGQPMGAYSSWAWFTFCHHVLLRSICYDLGINRNCYRILGDDIIIGNESVALKYLDLMDGLGVIVHKDKSFVSTRIKEFAKRYYYNEIEISPIQTRSIYDTYSHFSELWSVFKNYTTHGWEMPNPDALKRLYSQVFELPRRKSSRIASKIENLNLVYELVHGDKASAAHSILMKSAHGNITCCPSMKEVQLVYEFLAALQIGKYQDTLVQTQRDVARLANKLKILEADASIPLDHLPVYGVHVKKQNDVLTDQCDLEYYLTHSNGDFIQLFELATIWVPDPRRTITQRVSPEKASDVNLISNQLFRELSTQAKLMQQVLDSDDI
ncbi:MAG: RNA-dependent RNA polymerase [Hangzhou altica cyanea mitovirus 1]|nr:MAG: RNA-dependent RNA polymerase [Hangzhou altica cyanea mitovirus 1]